MTGEKIITVPNLCSWLVAVWGAVVLSPYSDVFPKNPTLYGTMTGLVNSEAFWGGLWTSWGLIGLVFAILGRPRWTAFSVFTATMMLSALYFIADPQQPGGVGDPKRGHGPNLATSPHLRNSQP